MTRRSTGAAICRGAAAGAIGTRDATLGGAACADRRISASCGRRIRLWTASRPLSAGRAQAEAAAAAGALELDEELAEEVDVVEDPDEALDLSADELDFSGDDPFDLPAPARLSVR